MVQLTSCAGWGILAKGEPVESETLIYFAYSLSGVRIEISSADSLRIRSFRAGVNGVSQII